LSHWAGNSLNLYSEKEEIEEEEDNEEEEEGRLKRNTFVH